MTQRKKAALDPEVNSSLRRMFEGANDPNGWLLTATRLRNAAGIFFNEYDWTAAKDGPETVSPLKNYLPITFMLCGFAIENLVKAICIQNGTVSENGKLNKALQSHDFEKLLRTAGLEEFLSEPEISFLMNLQSVVMWAGRYPVPLFDADFLPVDLPDNSRLIPGTVYGSSDFQKFTDIFDKLRERLA